MRPHVFRPAAAADIERAYAWYERERIGLGEDFLAEVSTSVQAVLRIGKAFGCAVTHVDPIESGALYDTMADLARDRPGIAVSELCDLLNIDRITAEAIAGRVVSREGLRIGFDSPR